MQLMPPPGNMLGEKEAITSTAKNILLGTHHFSS